MDRPDVQDDRIPVVPEPDRILPSSDPEAPEADAIEQASEVAPRGHRHIASLPPDANEADALDQADEVPDDYDDDRAQ